MVLPTFSMVVETVSTDKKDEKILTLIEQAGWEVIKTAKSKVFSSNEEERKIYFKNLWESRINDIKNGNAILLLVNKESTPVCSVFYYPSKLTNDKKINEEVVVASSFVTILKDKDILFAAANELTNYAIKKFDNQRFLSYIPNEFTIFAELLSSQGYKPVQLSGFELSPINQLDMFPEKESSKVGFQWYIREITN